MVNSTLSHLRGFVPTSQILPIPWFLTLKLLDLHLLNLTGCPNNGRWLHLLTRGWIWEGSVVW